VNDELGELARGLSAAERALAPGGRLAVVTFHSLEDGIAKRFLKERATPEPRGSRHLPPGESHVRQPSFRFVNQRPLSPSEAEIVANPRARSARMRAAVRTDAPAWPQSAAEAAIPHRGHRA
jgi:16S rRNA (cytosine1402-N4)-methyltransferase